MTSRKLAQLGALILSSTPIAVRAQSTILDYRYVAIQLSTEDARTSNRPYKAVNTSLSALVRCNSRLSTYAAGGDSNTFAQAPSAISSATPAPTATPGPTAPPAPIATPAPTATPKAKKPKSAKETAKDGNKKDTGG